MKSCTSSNCNATHNETEAFLDSVNLPKISESAMADLDFDLTIHEIKEAIK